MENKHTKGIHPIQIIESKTNANHRWITFDKYIFPNGDGLDRKHPYFENIIPFHRDKRYPFSMIKLLTNWHTKSPIYDTDIIRNPTIEEIQIIKSILVENGYKLNLKTYKLINYGKRNEGNTTVRD